MQNEAWDAQGNVRLLNAMTAQHNIDADKDADAATLRQQRLKAALRVFKNELMLFEADLLDGTAQITDGLIKKLGELVTEFYVIREAHMTGGCT